MQFNAQKAGSFVAVADFADDTRKIIAFSPDAPIREVFEAFWPIELSHSVLAGTRFHPLPIRIEILPDERTVPRDDRFDDVYASATTTAQ